MNLFCIEYSSFTKQNHIKIKHKKDRKINLYPCCIDCGFKRFESINEKKLSDLLEN